MSNINLDKTSWELVQIVKDITKKNVVNAVTTNQLNVHQEDLSKLLTILDSSMSEGYNKSYNNFSKKFTKISKELANVDKEATPKKRK